MPHLLTLFLFASCFCVADMQGIIVIVEPQEAKIPLNKEVNITCKVTGDKQYWLADGAVLDNNTMTERGIAITNISRVPGNMSSNLTVIAIPMNDNLRIGCQGIKQSTREQKFNRSILTVLGISPVTGISYNPVTSILSWSGPSFHSRDIPQTADTTYAVEVNGAMVEKNTMDTHVKINKSCNFGITIKACTAQYCSVASKTESGYIVQDLEIKRNENGSFTITCVYDVQKTGLGCRVVVKNIYSGGDEHLDIFLPSNSIQILLASGIYSVTVLELINGSISTQSCVPSKQIYVMHPSYTNSDNVNTKGVSTSSTTAIAPATSLPTAPRTATSAPTTTSIITTEITPATFCTALTSTTDANGPSTTSSVSNKNYAEIIAGSVVATVIVLAIIVAVAVSIVVMCYRKCKLHITQKDPSHPTAQVNDTSDQSTIAETSFATSSSNEGSELAMYRHVSPSTELVNDGNSTIVATDPRLGCPEIPPGSSLNGEDCNESRYDSASQEETTIGGKKSRIVSSLSPVPQDPELQGVNRVPIQSKNSNEEYKKFL